MVALIILIHPALYIYWTAMGTAPSDPLAFAGALVNAIVGLCFLLPGVTRWLFEPAARGLHRFLFGTAAFFAVVLTFGISALAIVVPTSGEMREMLTSGLGALFQAPLVLFIIMSLVPGYYTKRRGRRARLRDQAHAETQYTRLSEVEENGEPGADWDRRVHAYNLHQAEAAVATEAPPQPRDESAHPIVLRLMFGLSVTIIAGVGFLSFYGWRIAQFVPTAELAALAPDLYIPMLIAMVAMGGLCAIATDARRPGAAQSIWLRLPVLVAIAMGLSAIGSQAFLTKGLPGALSFLSMGPPSQTTLTVSGIGKERVRRGCDYTVFARGLDLIGPKSMMLCEVGGEVWRLLRVGDQITLHGYKTDYGFRYDRVTR